MEDIADRLGITKGGLSKALNGNPTLSTLRKVAEVLQVPITALFADEADAPPDDGEVYVVTIPKGVKTIKIKIED